MDALTTLMQMLAEAKAHVTHWERERDVWREGSAYYNRNSDNAEEWHEKAEALEAAIKAIELLSKLDTLFDFGDGWSPNETLTVDDPSLLNEYFAEVYELLSGRPPMWKTVEPETT